MCVHQSSNNPFGTLTPVFFVLISRRYLTHRRWFPCFTTCRFWVGKFSVGKILCENYPYFTPQANISTRLYWGIFQQEPAIASLDRLFTPNHRSSKCMYTTLVRTSIPLSGNFILFMIRSAGFGSRPSDLTPFQTCFRFGYIFLTLPLKRTPWPVFQNVRYKPTSSLEAWPVTTCNC